MTYLRSLLSDAWLQKGAELAVAIVLILLVTSIVKRMLLARVTDPDHRRQVRRTIRIATVALIFIATGIVMSSSLGNLGLSLGVASAGIAFALQAPISNVAAWFANSGRIYYKVGDRIQIGGVSGDVIGINAMVTTLMEVGGWVQADQYNGRVVKVSNSSIFTAPLYNYSADFAILWDELRIPIKYGGDRKLVVEILMRVATEVTESAIKRSEDEWRRLVERYAIEDAQITPMVTLVATDNWMEFTLRYVSLYDRRRTTKTEIFNRILDEFDKVPDRLSIASATYDVVGFPPVNVNLSR